MLLVAVNNMLNYRPIEPDPDNRSNFLPLLSCNIGTDKQSDQL